MIKIWRHLSSVNIEENKFLKASTIKHKIMERDSAKMSAVETKELSFFLSLETEKDEVILEIISGSPLAMMVIKTIKIENATW